MSESHFLPPLFGSIYLERNTLLWYVLLLEQYLENLVLFYSFTILPERLRRGVREMETSTATF